MSRLARLNLPPVWLALFLGLAGKTVAVRGHQRLQATMEALASALSRRLSEHRLVDEFVGIARTRIDNDHEGWSSGRPQI